MDTLRKDYEEIIERNHSEIQALKNNTTPESDLTKKQLQNDVPDFISAANNEHLKNFINFMSTLTESENEEFAAIIATLRVSHPNPKTLKEIYNLFPNRLTDKLDTARLDHSLQKILKFGIVDSTPRGFKLSSDGLEYAINWLNKIHGTE